MRLRSCLSGMLLWFSAMSVLASPLVLHVSPLGDYQRVLGPSLNDLRGLTLEIAAGTLRLANLPVQLARPAPWLRAQKEAEESPGALLVGLARVPEREAHWQWVGVMVEDRVLAFTLQGRPVYRDWAAIQRARVKVVTRLGSASAAMARAAGLPLQTADDMSSNYLALINGQAGVLLTQEMDVYASWQQMMQSPYRQQFRTGLHGVQRTALQAISLWMVVSRGTPAAEVERLRRALQAFRQTADYHNIVAQYRQRAAMMEQGKLPTS
ncbi:hypothetical protein THUN1379_07970 [Paludibacterium sp. THUN1379]|uniref:hypothetical protein n=1 Tax=Paludibacterium sp. THUN1379 TaxID=3112107 RepID=UPI00308994BF|nr:hypothetical protein THUN1379_07970 [Paludibacterium sp. THUN1379]